MNELQPTPEEHHWLIGRDIAEVEQRGETRADYGARAFYEEELRAALAREREAAERALTLAALAEPKATPRRKR